MYIIPAVGEEGLLASRDLMPSWDLSFWFWRHFFLVLTSFWIQCNLFKILSQRFCSKYNMSPVILPQLIKQDIFMPAEIHSTRFPILNKQKMGTSICDVAVTLKQQRKNGNIFFLKQDTFSYKRYVWNFKPKMHKGYTGAYTNTCFFSFTIIIANIIYRYSSDDISP